MFFRPYVLKEMVKSKKPFVKLSKNKNPEPSPFLSKADIEAAKKRVPLSHFKKLKYLLIGGAFSFSIFEILTDEGLRRTFNFWTSALPIFFHYQLSHQFLKNEDPQKYQNHFFDLHEKYSPKVQEKCVELRGFYLKAAQMISLRTEFLPPQYVKWCSKMQDQAPVSFPASTAKDIIKSELQLGEVGDVFEIFDEEPIGCASIGQCYQGKLKEEFGGKWVAVKIQAPGVEKLFRSDLKTCKNFCKLAMPQHVVQLEEVEKHFMTEFDYRQEAKNLNLVRRNLLEKSGEWGEILEIPRAYEDLCTRSVLVMDLLKGEKILDGLRRLLQKEAERVEKEVEEVEEEFKKAVFAKSEVDNLGLESWKLFLYRLSVRTSDLLSFCLYSCSGGMVGSWEWSEIPKDHLKILENVMKAHGHQIFIDGAFNGDPHPGNILMLENGKIGLIDFGQVKRLSLPQRLQAAKLIIALNDDDRKRVAKIQKDMGLVTLNMDDDENIWRHLCFWADRDTEDVTGGLNIHEFLEKVERENPLLELPKEMVMVLRCSMMIRSLGLAFGLRVRTTDYWRPFAEEILKREGVWDFERNVPDYEKDVGYVKQEEEKMEKEETLFTAFST